MMGLEQSGKDVKCIRKFHSYIILHTLKTSACTSNLDVTFFIEENAS